MSYTIAKKFNLLSLLKFTVPAIIMMLFMSLYTIVDGIFISRLIGTTALSGLNIVYPFISFIHAVAIMFAAGGSAIIAKKMGEGRDEEARNTFSLIVYTGIFIGICISVFCYFRLYIYENIWNGNDRCSISNSVRIFYNFNVWNSLFFKKEK